MKCVVCGRLPEVECCEICHRVHRALWQEVLDARVDSTRAFSPTYAYRGPVRALAKRVLDNRTDVRLNSPGL